MKVTDRGVVFPLIPGHEIAGTVSEIGGLVEDVSEGDEVLVYPWIGCGKCPACVSGNENLCDNPQSLGIYQDGGYAEFVLIPDSRYLVNVSGMELEILASLSCAGLTAFSSIKKALSNKPETILLVGAGGLGLLGVEIVKILTNAKIICIDVNDEKLKTANELGADEIFNSKDPEVKQKILSITDNKGVDSIVDFVNNPNTVELGLSVIRKRGHLVLVGLFGGSIKLHLVTIPLKAITIQGSYTGNISELVELVDLVKQGKLKMIISKKYSLLDSNEALTDLKEGKIIGCSIIKPN
jgi:propanol-preferring alcohol dehydrogenase